MTILLVTSVQAYEPVGFRKWQTGSSSYRLQIGGPVRNYQRSDGTWKGIDNNWTVTDDSLYTIRHAVLKVEADRHGRVTTVFTRKGVQYRVSQRLEAVVFFRLSDSLWIPIYDAPRWCIPMVDSNVVTWPNVFPHVNYRLIKSNGAIRHEIMFQSAFLDSVVGLYDQRSDSSDLYLANVAEVIHDNLDVVSRAGGAQRCTVLKRFNEGVLEQPWQKLRFPGSDSLPGIQVWQRYQTIAGQLYLLELVKMSDVKRLHARFPCANVNHNAIETLSDDHITDTWLSRWSNDGDNNYGSTTDMDAFNTTPYLFDLDLSDIGGPVTVTAAVCSLRVAWMSASTDFFLRRVVTAWTEGVEAGSPVTSGNPGATWNYAKDFYSGEGSDVPWAGGGTWGSGDFTAVRDTFLTASNGWTQFNNDNFQDDIEKMINGVYEVTSFAVWAEADSRTIYGTEYSDVGKRPRIVVQYTVSESGGRPYLRRRRMLRSQEN